MQWLLGGFLSKISYALLQYPLKNGFAAPYICLCCKQKQGPSLLRGTYELACREVPENERSVENSKQRKGDASNDR